MSPTVDPAFYSLPEPRGLISDACAQYAAGFLHKTLHARQGDTFDFTMNSETKYTALFEDFNYLEFSLLRPVLYGTHPRLRTLIGTAFQRAAIVNPLKADIKAIFQLVVVELNALTGGDLRLSADLSQKCSTLSTRIDGNISYIRDQFVKARKALDIPEDDKMNGYLKISYALLFLWTIFVFLMFFMEKTLLVGLIPVAPTMGIGLGIATGRFYQRIRRSVPAVYTDGFYCVNAWLDASLFLERLSSGPIDAAEREHALRFIERFKASVATQNSPLTGFVHEKRYWFEKYMKEWNIAGRNDFFPF